MSKRNDVHSPTNLITENYEYVYSLDNQAPGGMMNPYAIEMAGKVRATNRDRGLSQCHHCGAHIRYVAILEHVPTGDHIAVGETCLENRFDRATADFQKLRKAAELDRQKQRIRSAVNEFAAANPDLAFLAETDDALYEAACPEHSLENYKLREYGRKLNYYGSLFDSAVEWARKMIVRDAEAAARRAAEALEPPAGPVPTGRVEIEGTVVGIKWTEDNGYGSVKKLMVKLANGSKVYVSEPAAISTERGDVVKLTCSVEASAKDETFGFGKRPSKATIISTNEEVAA